MAYNKSKYVEAAQKLLNQGKVPQAIAEYQQILKYEPKDQVTLMTIGELYIRQGETFQAIDYFERLAQIFVGDGFLTKAIAVYKRIAKLAPEEIRPLERLADLYVQQGVMSEARPLFLQLAEIHLKNNRQPEAVALLKKLLTAEPDNLRIQIRLADLYQAMGQNGEAMETYVSAAQRALARGDHAECEKLADKALKIDATNLAAITVKSRSYSAQGNLAQAAEVLHNLPNLEKGGEQSEFLLDLYIKQSNWDKATELGLSAFDADEKNFSMAHKVAQALLESGQTDRAMALISKLRIPMIDAGEHESVAHLLTDLAARTPGRLEPHEWLVDTYGRTSDSFRLPDALAHLGDALVEANQLQRAKEVFERLVDREPESDSAKRRLNDVLRKLGLMGAEAPAPVINETLQAEIPKPDAPKVRPGVELPAPAPSAESPIVSAVTNPPPVQEEQLDEETQKFIAQSLTDVDLFASYGLTQKAIGLLEAILRRAPRHTPTLEKLLDFVLGAGDDRRTAELAAQLEKIHRERHDSAASDRFGELRRRFQRAAGLTDEDLFPEAKAAATETTAVEAEVVEEMAVSQEETPQAAVEELQVPAANEEEQEVDLSEEWANMLTPAEPAAPAAPEPAIPEELPSIEELLAPKSAAPAAKPETPVQPAETDEFEVPFEAPEEAPAEVAAEAAPATHSFSDLSAEISDTAKAPESFEVPVPEPPAPAEPEEEEVAISFDEKPEEVAASAPPKAAAPSAPVPVAAAPATPESEFELDQDYELVIEQEPLVAAHETIEKPSFAPPEAQPVAKATGGEGMASDQFLAELASEIDQLGIDQLSPAFSQPEAPAAAEKQPVAEAKSTGPAEHEPLKEVFDEFRAELGEMGAEDEDLETHYNLGIAFREMGLLEEAISEFQKVAKANDRGKAFRYAMQCCTLLGLAFMEKGQPSIAAIWYERALQTPGVDAESKLALRYDLGVAQESAGEQEAALKSFSQVYAANIDYRDVADRIASLQKTHR